MHSVEPSSILIHFLICACLASSLAFGQKIEGEIALTRCWSYPVDDAITLGTDGTRLYLGFEGGRIGALSLDGKKMWTSELGGEINSNISSHDGGLFLTTATVHTDGSVNGGGVLRALSKETGITNWTTKLTGHGHNYLSVNSGQLIIASRSGWIQAVNVIDGTDTWKMEVAGGVQGEPLFTDQRLFFASGNRNVISIESRKGKVVATHDAGFAVTALASTSSGQIIVGDERGNISSFLEGSRKPLWRFKSGGQISKVLSVGDGLLATSHDNFVYFLADRNGGVEWKKRMAGRIAHATIFLDRYALVVGLEESGLVLTDLTGGKAEAQVAFDPDERLVASPVTANATIYLLTNKAVFSYTINGCTNISEGGVEHDPDSALK